MRLFKNFLDKVFFAAGVVLFLQLPNFVDHYTQRYGGYYDANLEQLSAYQDIADRHYDGDLEKMAQKFEEPDHNQGIRDAGKQLQSDVEKVQSLHKGIEILENRSLLRKVIYILFNPNKTLFVGTLKAYKPGTPFTTDALFSGMSGGLLFTALFNLLIQSQYFFRKRKRKI